MRSITVSKLSRVLAPATLAALCVFTAACGAAPTETNGDPTGSASEAVVMSDSFTLSPSIFAAFVKTLQVSQISVALSKGTLTATPSPAMTSLLGMPTLSQSVPTSVQFPVSIPVLGTVTATANVSSFSVTPGSVAITMNGNGAAASASWSASIDISLPSPLPNPNVTLSGTIATQIARAPVASSDRLEASSLSIDVTYSSSSCGALNWCAGMVEGAVESESSGATASLSGALKGFVNTQLAAKAVTQQIDGALDYLSNGTLNPHTGGAPWAVYAGTLQFNADGANWSATHWVPPAPLTGCDATQECDGQVDAYCSSDMDPGSAGNDNQQLQRLAGSTWIDVGTLNDDDDPTPPINETVTYRICASNPVGSVCSAAFTFYVNQTSCGGGSPGPVGGGGGLNGGGDPCHGNCMAQ